MWCPPSWSGRGCAPCSTHSQAARGTWALQSPLTSLSGHTHLNGLHHSCFQDGSCKDEQEQPGTRVCNPVKGPNPKRTALPCMQAVLLPWPSYVPVCLFSHPAGSLHSGMMAYSLALKLPTSGPDGLLPAVPATGMRFPDSLLSFIPISVSKSASGMN